MLKTVVKKLLPTFYWDLRKQFQTFSNLSKRYGHFRSIRNWSCLDSNGKPIPWYTYPAIEYLSHIDFSRFKVLEYGSGNSTLWWATKCDSLVSVEGDSKWYEKIRDGVGTLRNVSYSLETNEESYVRQSNLSVADIVIIDGIHRSKCADWFIQSTADKSHQTLMLIFDNADWYPRTMEKLRKSIGWIEMDLHGFGPINDYTWTTTIFINPNRGGELIYLHPLMSACGVVDTARNNSDDV